MENVFVRHSKPVKKTLPRSKTGIPGFDAVLGGGLVCGTVTLIEQDAIEKNYIAFVRCFLGEGASNKEKIFIYGESNYDEIIPPIGKIPKQSSGNLRIAWRYDKNTQNIGNSNIYDLSKSIKYPILSTQGLTKSSYTQIYDDIYNSIESSGDTHKRIFIKLDLENWSPKELYSFLISLRSLIRSLNATCLVTACMKSCDADQRFIIRKYTDFVVAIKDIGNSLAFKEYCAMLVVVKPLKLQSLGNYPIGAVYYGVLRDNKYVNVENLSLPPAESMQKVTLDY